MHKTAGADKLSKINLEFRYVKLTYKNWLYFLCTNNEESKNEIKTIAFA